MKPIELERQQIYTWLNKQIKAYKLQHSIISDDPKYTSVWTITPSDSKEIMMYGLLTITKSLGVIPLVHEWDGNNCCNTNYSEVMFFYRGYKFFQLYTPDELVDSIDFIEEDIKNERK